MALTLNDVKIYLRLCCETTDEDELIKHFMAAAADIIKNQSGKKEYRDSADTLTPIENDSLFMLCIKMLVAHWYDNRGMADNGGQRDVPYSVKEIINHISLAGYYQ